MAKFGLGAVGYSARKAVGPAPEREQIPPQREEGEHWRSVGGSRIPPEAVPKRMEELTSLDAEDLPDTRTVVQSTQAPSNLSNCNEHPLQFSLLRFEIGGLLVC
jgi:hypothetical protein